MKLIRLTRDQVAKVDDEDFVVLSQWKWYAELNWTNQKFYATRNERGIDGRQHKVKMHRFLLSAPKGIDIDHRNLDTLDNRRDNIRLATREQNQHNRGIQRNNTSGFKGVSIRKDCPMRPFQSHIRVKGKSVCLGHFETAKEASEAYQSAVLERRGEFGR